MLGVDLFIVNSENLLKVFLVVKLASGMFDQPCSQVELHIQHKLAFHRYESLLLS